MAPASAGRAPVIKEGLEIGRVTVQLIDAKDLPTTTAGGMLEVLRPGGVTKHVERVSRGGDVNPFAELRLQGNAQRSKAVADSTNPNWRRENVELPLRIKVDDAGEMDASLKIFVCHEERDAAAGSEEEPAAEEKTADVAEKAEPASALSHGGGGGMLRGVTPPPPAAAPARVADVGDVIVIGSATVSLTALVAGETSHVDEWVPLSEGGRIHIAADFDLSLPVPQVGDCVVPMPYRGGARLFPLPRGTSFWVEEVLNDGVLRVSYDTPENWKCFAELPRSLVVALPRDRVPLLHRMEGVASTIYHSPLADHVSSAWQRLPDEGLTSVGGVLWGGVVSTASRWRRGGIDAARSDIAWGFGFAEERLEVSPAPEGVAALSGGEEAVSEGKVEEDEDEDVPAVTDVECPITGVPMHDPVVAADGHTYERAAIERWFSEHDTSPLTGEVLPTTALFPNWALRHRGRPKAAEVPQAQPSGDGPSETARAQDAAADDETKEAPAVTDGVLGGGVAGR